MRSTTIGEVAELFDGPHATPTRTDEGPYFLNISSLNNGRLDLDLSDHVSESDFAKWTRRVTPQPGDLLFSYETRIGEAALMPEGVNACLGRRMALLRFDRTQVDPRYFLYLYLSPDFQKLIGSHTIHGATVNRIPLKLMPSWTISLPSLDRQRSIAEVLGALDDKIAANRKLAAVAEALLSARFSALQLDEEYGDQIRLDAYFELNPKCAKPQACEPTYLDMQKLPTSDILVSDWDQRPAKSGTRFMNGDTLLARITPCLENRKVGYVDFLDDGEVGLGSTEYIVFRARPGVPKELAFFLVTSSRFRATAMQHMVGTSGRQRLSAADVAGFTLRKIEDSKLAEWGGDAAPLLKHLGSLRDENGTLASLREALLPRLMSGELRVRDGEKLVENLV